MNRLLFTKFLRRTDGKFAIDCQPPLVDLCLLHSALMPIDPQRRQTVTDMLEAQEVCRSAKGKIDVPIVERLLRFKP